jgi:hypothetical protein
VPTSGATDRVERDVSAVIVHPCPVSRPSRRRKRLLTRWAATAKTCSPTALAWLGLLYVPAGDGRQVLGQAVTMEWYSLTNLMSGFVGSALGAAVGGVVAAYVARYTVQQSRIAERESAREARREQAAVEVLARVRPTARAA